MLNTTIPTLEIKTTGADLSTVDSLYITIKQGGFQAFKSNDDIEVDNDIISLSLTREEVSQFAEMDGISISILAIGNDGEAINVRIAWVKRGSRTGHVSSGGGSGGSTAVSNEVWYPTVSTDGIITWTKSTSETPPVPRNIKGEKGDNGVTPHIDSATGNWFIGNNDTGVKARGTDGKDGANGTDGKDGFSPEITENSGNNDSTYKLDITTKSGSFTTPNLKGKDGTGGGASDDYLPLTGGMISSTKREMLALNNIGENQTDTIIGAYIGSSEFCQMVLRKRTDGTMFQIWDVGQEIPELFTIRPDLITYKQKKIMTENEVPFRFGIDEAGNYGYYKGESFMPFGQGGSGSGSSISNLDFDKFDIITKTVFVDMSPVGGNERVSVIDRS